MNKKSTSKKRPLVARKVGPVVRLGIADFRCNACGQIYRRDLGWKAWTPSFCEITGRDARLYRVSSPSKPNPKVLVPRAPRGNEQPVVEISNK